MEQSLDELPLRIREAVLRFCSGSKIEEVKKYEAYFTSAELEKFGYPDLSGTQRPDEPKHFDSRQMENRRRLNEAWDRVFLDFRARLERGEMVITGVKMHPRPATEHVVIPGQWATDFAFDALKSTVTLWSVRYLNVLVGEKGWFASDTALGPEPVVADFISDRLPPITSENLRDLTDDEVLLLLEEHARRVAEGPDAKLIAPGKISLMPIIHRRLRYRASLDQLEPKVTWEAAVLEAWIASRVQSHQTPTKDSIANSISKSYAALKAQSKAI